MLLSLVFLSCLASLLVSFCASLVFGSDERDCDVSACLGAAFTSVSDVLSAAKTMVAVPANNPATKSEIMERFILMLLFLKWKTRSSIGGRGPHLMRLFCYIYATTEMIKSYVRSHVVPLRDVAQAG